MISSALSKFHGVKAKSSLPTEQPKADRVVAVVAVIAKTPDVSKPVVPVVVKPTAVAVASPVVKVPLASPVILQPAKATVVASKAEVKERVITPEELEHAIREAAISGPMVDPNTIELEMPVSPVVTPTDPQAGTRNLKIRWVEEGYFDAGYERLLGTFTTQILRYGIRYGQDDLHAYFRNETLNTNGTGLPYPQAVTGTSVGLEARHWFPGDKMYAAVSLGEGIGGYSNKKEDFRYGLVGYTSWAHNKWFSDFYGELFYIAIAADTFFDARIRSGRKISTDKRGYWWDYVVGQYWLSGQVESGTENRAEAGIGVAYVFQSSISINFELRGGYAYRSSIDDGGDRAYFNPTIILSGGFYKGK